MRGVTIVLANYWSLIIILPIAVVALYLVWQATERQPGETPSQATGQRALGASIQDVWDDPPTYIDDFTNMVGTPPRIVMWYQNWEQDSRKHFDPAKMDAVVDRGAMPMVTWAPRDPTAGTAEQPKYALKNIASGRFDDYITQWADDARDWGNSCQVKHQRNAPCPIYLRFAHEMNGNWMPWSPGVNGNTTTDWIDAWEHVHQIFSQEKATNVVWIWSPGAVFGTPETTTCGGDCPSLSELYPTGTDPISGKPYVDWTALDGFNWGTSQSGSRWQTAAQIFGPSYDEITTQVAPDKPFMISEIGSAEQGGDKANWITNTFNTDIPNRLPKTQAVVWFSYDRTAEGETDWRVDTSRASLDAYKAVAASSAWQGLLPSQ